MQKIVLILVVLSVACNAGCKRNISANKVTTVVYVKSSGSILPELGWTEQIVITENTVVFKRYGQAMASKVNAGTWELQAGGLKVVDLFINLSSIDYSTIFKSEVIEGTDGAGSSNYTVVFSNGESFSMLLGYGTIYSMGNLIIDPVVAFKNTLPLPVEAIPQYRY